MQKVQDFLQIQLWAASIYRGSIGADNCIVDVDVLYAPAVLNTGRYAYYVPTL